VQLHVPRNMPEHFPSAPALQSLSAVQSPRAAPANGHVVIDEGRMTGQAKAVGRCIVGTRPEPPEPPPSPPGSREEPEPHPAQPAARQRTV
jgi:hypothetical protein